MKDYIEGLPTAVELMRMEPEIAESYLDKLEKILIQIESTVKDYRLLAEENTIQ